jgi:ketosteroid isomerase-like protein
MSRANVDRLLSATESFNRGDLEGWLHAFAPEVVFEPQVAAMDGTYRGRDAIEGFFTTIWDIHDAFEVKLDDVRDLGDRVLAIGVIDSIAKESGIEQRTPVAIVTTYRSGLVTHFKDYGKRARALEAVGLREP